MTELLTVAEAARRIGCSVALVRRWCANDEMPAFKKGKTWLINSQDIDKHPPVGTFGKGRSKKISR